MKISAKERDAAIAAASRASITETAIELRASETAAEKLTPAQVDELLAKAVARERVEVVIDLLAWEQGKRDAAGNVIPNRNRVRFRDGAMMALGRSGKGTPYLRDHDKWSMAAVGGQVIESKTVKVDDAGHYEIRQRVSVTEPTAVERVLRGLTRHVSIGWRPTGPILCTACDAEVLTECWHFPGDTATVDGQEVEVWWEYQDAELVETSEVPVPAVPTAGLEAIRSAFAAAHENSNRGPAPHNEDNDTMKLTPALAAFLGIAVTASDDEIDAAVAKVKPEVEGAAAVKAELAILKAEAAIDKSTPVDKFIQAAVAEGRITPADEGPWRELFGLAPDRARARMAERAPGSATPAGKPLQSGTPLPEDVTPAPAASDRDAKARAVVEKAGRNYDNVAKFAKAFGAKDPKAAIAKHVAGIEEA